MKVEWQEIDGEQYLNDPVRGWLKKLPVDSTIPKDAVYWLDSGQWNNTDCAEDVYDLTDLETYDLVYAVPCDPPCTLSPQASLDVCLEYVGYKVSKAAQKLPPEVKDAFFQKVFALKQTFALEVDKLLEEVKHG